MGFKNQAAAVVWSVEPGKGNFTSVRLSTSRKNKEGNYEQDFSGYCNFVGEARKKAEDLKEKDRIRLGNVEVTTRYNKDTQREYVNYTVFDFEPFGNSKPEASRSAQSEFDGEPAEGDEELPF